MEFVLVEVLCSYVLYPNWLRYQLSLTPHFLCFESQFLGLKEKHAPQIPFIQISFKKYSEHQPGLRLQRLHQSVIWNSSISLLVIWSWLSSATEPIATTAASSLFVSATDCGSDRTLWTSVSVGWISRGRHLRLRNSWSRLITQKISIIRRFFLDNFTFCRAYKYSPERKKMMLSMDGTKQRERLTYKRSNVNTFPFELLISLLGTLSY